jgi:hypothetical protein
MEKAVFRDTIATYIHHQLGVEMQWESVVSEMVESKIVVQESLITYPVKPIWLRQFLTRSFWKKLAERPYAEQMTAFYMPKAEEALVRDPVDGYDRWAVRKDSRLAMAKKNFKIGNHRKDAKRGPAKLEIIELYEAKDRRLLRAKIQQLERAQGARFKKIPEMGERDKKGVMSSCPRAEIDALSSWSAVQLAIPRSRRGKNIMRRDVIELREERYKATNVTVVSTFGECSVKRKQKGGHTEERKRLHKNIEGINSKSHKKRTKLTTKRDLAVMSSYCAIQT